MKQKRQQQQQQDDHRQKILDTSDRRPLQSPFVATEDSQQTQSLALSSSYSTLGQPSSSAASAPIRSSALDSSSLQRDGSKNSSIAFATGKLHTPSHLALLKSTIASVSSNNPKAGWSRGHARRDMSSGFVRPSGGGGDQRSFTGAISSHRTHLPASAKYLLTVIPPEDFPLEPPHPRNAAATGSFAHMRRGTLLPLYPTLNGQLYAIAREYGLPSIGGLSIYLCEDGDGNFGPRIGEAAWQALWSSFFSDETEQPSNALGLTPPVPLSPFEHRRAASDRQSPAANWTPSTFACCLPENSNSSWRTGSPYPLASEMAAISGTGLLSGARPSLRLASALPIVGRVEWIIERHRAAWWPSWIGEAASVISSVRSREPPRPPRTRSLQLSKGLAKASSRIPMHNVSAPTSPLVQAAALSGTGLLAEEETDVSGTSGDVTNHMHSTRSGSSDRYSSHGRPRSSSSQQWLPQRCEGEIVLQALSGYKPLADDDDDGEEEEEGQDSFATRSDASRASLRRLQRKSQTSMAASSRHISKASRELHRLTPQSDDVTSEQDSANKRRAFKTLTDADESMWWALREAPRPPAAVPNGFHVLAQRSFARKKDFAAPPDNKNLASSKKNGTVKDWIQQTQQSPDLLRDRVALVPEDTSYVDERGYIESEEENLGIPPQDDVKDIMEIRASKGLENRSTGSQVPTLVRLNSLTTMSVYAAAEPAVEARTPPTKAAKLLSPIALDRSDVFKNAPLGLASLSSHDCAYTGDLTETSMPLALLDVDKHLEVTHKTSLKPRWSPGAGSVNRNPSNSTSTDVSGLEDFERALELLSPVTSAHGNLPSLAQLGLSSKGGKMTSRDSLNAAHTLSTSVAPSPRWLPRNRQSAHAAGSPIPKQLTGVRPVSASALTSPSFSAPSQTLRAGVHPGSSSNEKSALASSAAHLMTGIHSLVATYPAVPPISSPLPKSFDGHISPGSSSDTHQSHHMVNGVARGSQDESERNGKRESVISSVADSGKTEGFETEETEREGSTECVQSVLVERQEHDHHSEPVQPVVHDVELTHRQKHPAQHVSELGSNFYEPTIDGQISVSSSAMTLGAETRSQDNEEGSHGDTVIIYESPTAASSANEVHARLSDLCAQDNSSHLQGHLKPAEWPQSGNISSEMEGPRAVSMGDDSDTTTQHNDVAFATLTNSPMVAAFEDRQAGAAPKQPSPTEAGQHGARKSAQFWKHAVLVPSDTPGDNPGDNQGDNPGDNQGDNQRDTHGDTLGDTSVDDKISYKIAASITHSATSPLMPKAEDARPSISRLIRGQSFSASSYIAPSSLVVTSDIGNATLWGYAELESLSSSAPSYIHDPLPTQSNVEVLAKGDIYSLDGSGAAAPLSRPIQATGELFDPDSHSGDDETSEMRSQDGSSRYSRYCYEEHGQYLFSTNNAGLSRRDDSGLETLSFYLERQLVDSRLSSCHAGKHLSGTSRLNVGDDVVTSIGLGLSDGDAPQWAPRAPVSLRSPLSSQELLYYDEPSIPCKSGGAEDADDVADDLDAMLSSIDAFNNGSARSWSRPSSGLTGTASGGARNFAGDMLGPARSSESTLSIGDDEHTLEAMRHNTREAVRQALTTSERIAYELAPSRASLPSTKNLTNLGKHSHQSLLPRRASTGLNRSTAGDPHRVGMLSPKPGRFKTLPPSPNVLPDLARDVQQPMSPLSASFTASVVSVASKSALATST